MLRRNALLVVICSASLLPAFAHAQKSCDLPLGPLAEKKSVALSIFNAIAKAKETPAKRAKYHIEMTDDGASWSIFESLKGGDSIHYFTNAHGVKMETVRQTFGGGGLGMSIDKCTAAISDVAYQR